MCGGSLWSEIVHTNSATATDTPAAVLASTAASAFAAAVPRLPINEESALARGLPPIARDSMAAAATKISFRARLIIIFPFLDLPFSASCVCFWAV